MAVAAQTKDLLTHNHLMLFPKASTFFSAWAIWAPLLFYVCALRTAWFGWNSWASSWQIKRYAAETKGCEYIAAWKRWWFHLKCISFCVAKSSNLNSVLLDWLSPKWELSRCQKIDALEMGCNGRNKHARRAAGLCDRKCLFKRKCVNVLFKNIHLLACQEAAASVLGTASVCKQQGRWISSLVNSVVFNADRPDISRFYPWLTLARQR